MCVYLCVYLCLFLSEHRQREGGWEREVRERESERECERVRESVREREREVVCVCVWVDGGRACFSVFRCVDGYNIFQYWPKMDLYHLRLLPSLLKSKWRKKQY